MISRPSTRGRRAAIAAATGALFVSLGGAEPVSALTVTVAGTRSANGSIRLCLTADPANFPACVDDARALRRSVPASASSLRFDALPHGHYAVAVIHDENNNRRLDKVAGIPREGYGFSRNAPVRFGPPRFSAAEFPVSGDAQVQQVRMRYIL